MKAGYLAPPLIVNFKWAKNEKPQQEIRFYPFYIGPSVRPSEPALKHKVTMNEGAHNSIDLGLHNNATDDYVFRYDLMKPFTIT